MSSKSQDLGMAAACLFFLLLSLAGIAAIFLTGEITGVDALLLLMVCAGMALLFAWLTLSALRDAGIFGEHEVATETESQPAANPAPAAAPAAPAIPQSGTAPAAPPRGAEGK